MLRDVDAYLDDMLDAIGRIQDYTAGMDKGALEADHRTLDAVLRNLEVLGEAAKQVPDAVRAEAPGIDWRKVAGLRDILIHGYFVVEFDIVWDIVAHRLDPLREQLRQLVAGRRR